MMNFMNEVLAHGDVYYTGMAVGVVGAIVVTLMIYDLVTSRKKKKEIKED